MGKTQSATLTLMNQAVMLLHIQQQTAPGLPSGPRTDQLMNSPAQVLADFRSQVTKLLQERDKEWEASRKLVEAKQLAATLGRVIIEARRADVPVIVRDAITLALGNSTAARIQDLPGPRLKELTGLPPTKAVRALCVWFGIVAGPMMQWPMTSLQSEEIEAFVRSHSNPFDLLHEADVASLLDLGAGDLSFATELVELYVTPLQQRQRELILHALDRLQPGSKLGGPLHPDRERLNGLRSRNGLSFQFYGDQDMFDLDKLDQAGKLAPRYTIATCWAPATPTFAYEPTRLSDQIITQELKRTKGVYRQTNFSGEPALEVQHGDRALLFPVWKFEIRGPLALLDLLARRGFLCVLGAVDTEVFWEILGQLLDDARYRPNNQPFTPDNLGQVFGEIFDRLSNLAPGESLSLSDCGLLRRQIPRILPLHSTQASFYRFRSVQVRRGAVFSGVPASSTARRFTDMAEESPPWMLILVPE
ncbi:MAG: hypothetical protein HXY51_01035 [Nitrospirae bacterium]|nr:hypothetical protein [Nitrospirota bacterium]